MSSVKIANGHNNTAGLMELQLLSPPLFSEFKAAEGVLTEWHDFEEQVLMGDRTYIPIGRPYVVWEFFQLLRTEMTYFLTTYGNLVTICTLNKSTNAYHNYNAKFKRPDLGKDFKWDTGYWIEAKLTFYDLEEL